MYLFIALKSISQVKLVIWCTCKVIYMWQRIQHPTFPILYDTRGIMIRIAYLLQIKPLHKSEVGSTPTMTFRVFRTCLVPSPPRTSSLEEPLIWKQALRLEAIPLGMAAISLSCSARWMPWQFHEADLYIFCSMMWSPILYMPRADL